jgi:hypothetical protein
LHGATAGGKTLVFESAFEITVFSESFTHDASKARMDSLTKAPIGAPVVPDNALGEVYHIIDGTEAPRCFYRVA